ncbi:MAG: superoxide dismutase [Alphaproteobacteria bacterium CG_4_9_14_3_um_filter_47_13]|nr:MAG: superoxide dismutase [Alphaproteobacteria bacterium CG_4_9_14_3_um_filter_47_13]
MTFELPDLPFAYDALAPHMSAETFEYHHDKHHKAYVDNGNKLLEESDLKGKPLEEIILKAEGGLFNNAAQHWNHSFFWKCLKPDGGGTSLPENIAQKIERDLGGYDAFKSKFTEACVTQFGSGWGWLAMDNKSGKLEILKTGNAGVPFTDGKTPLLTCDVWEHAYYIDYRNARPKYVQAFVDSMIHWEFVESLVEKGPMKIAA